MFFQECERLVGEFSELKEIIHKIDQMLHEAGPSSVFRPEEIASFLREKPSKVSGIFEILSENGLLHKEKYIECPDCGNLMDPEDYEKAVGDQDPFECTQCQRDLIQKAPEEIEVFRVNPVRIHIPNNRKEITSEITLPVPARFYQQFQRAFLEDPFKNTPLLRYYSSDPKLSKVKPFKGKRVLFILHFLRDLIPLVKACQSLGLDLRNTYHFYKDYPYPQRDAVKKWLEEQGAVVKPRSYIPQYLKQFTQSPSDRIGKILIIEDGGFFVPAIHREFTQLIPYVIGAVEQTTRGIRNAEGWQKEKNENKLQFPIMSVATSKLKSEFEPPYIAEAVVDNIKRLLPNISLRRKNVAVFGFGAIGRKIAEWLRENKVNVTIFEQSPERKLLVEGFTLADSSGQAAQNKKLVIGASGNESINSQVIASLSHGTYIVSASSELYEIDIEELTRQARDRKNLINDNGEMIGTTFVLPPDDRHVHVLANGYPINFWGFESMPEEASDLILSLILLCSAEIALGSYSKHGINSDAVNELAKKYKVAEKFLEFHQQG
jgi:S-adenosylhomocysteine hydrolase